MARTITLNSGTRGFEAHPRNWRDYTLCYPVVSRRSRGLSIGINLNPDRICNFDCVYCEVDRQDFQPATHKLPIPPKDKPRLQADLATIRFELENLLKLAHTGGIWQEPEFKDVAPELKRLNDIAFSGDGEPTTHPRFDEAVKIAIQARQNAGYAENEVKLVLITNATRLHHPKVKLGLELLRQHNGQIWAKLDAGTAEYYDLIDKTNVPFTRILANLKETAARQPITIQTCLMRLHGIGPSEAEIQAYCQRLNEIGGNLEQVQLYTVARRPPNQWVTSLPENELKRLAQTIRQTTNLPIEIFGGQVGLINLTT